MKKDDLDNRLFKNKLHIFLAGLFFLILAIFFYFKIVPCGNVSYHFSWPDNFFSSRSNFSEFRPGARIKADDKDYLKVISEPVYFSLFSPRNFDQAKVEITYFDNLSKETPIVELGLLKGGPSGSYELKPLQNKLIDSLKFSWSRIVDEDGLLILQKNKEYKNKEEFWQDFKRGDLKNCSADVFSCASFYNYPIETNYKLTSSATIFPLKITRALRGEHRFFVYFNKGDWYLNFDFRDLFLNDLNQDLKVEIFSENILVDSKVLNYERGDISKLAFDNNNKQGKIVGSLDFSGTEEKGALYTVVVKVDNNIIIEKTESSSNRLVFINKIWPVYGEKNLKLYTDTSFLSLKTFETDSLGRVYFNNEEHNLNKTYSDLLINTTFNKEVKELRLENSGSLIELNGVISLSQEKFFNPLPYKLDRFFSEDLGYSYLLTNYRSPKKEGDLKVAELSFDLAGVVREAGNYDFVISVPGLVHDSGYDGDYKSEKYLGIKKIKVKFIGKNLWQKLKEKYKK